MSFFLFQNTKKNFFLNFFLRFLKKKEKKKDVPTFTSSSYVPAASY